MEMSLSIPGKEPQIVDKAPSGRLYLDGNLGVDADRNQ